MVLCISVSIPMKETFIDKQCRTKSDPIARIYGNVKEKFSKNKINLTLLELDMDMSKEPGRRVHSLSVG